MVEITRCNLARGNIITAAYLGIQRVNNEKGGAVFENAEIMPHASQEREGKKPERFLGHAHGASNPKRAKEWMREADSEN